MQKTLSVKADIMEVAEKLFCRFGFDKISMDRIAKESNHAKGSLYYHFASKQNLVNSILEKEVNNIKDSLLQVIGNNKISENQKIKEYATTRMQSMNVSYSYHTALKNKILQSKDTQLIECYGKVHDSLTTWEKEQLTAIIVAGKNKGIFNQNVNASKFVDMLMLTLSSMEFPFFICGTYEKHNETFNYMIDEILFKALETN